MQKFIYPIFIVLAAGLLTITETGCTAKAKKAYHLAKANRYYDSGQFDRAEIEYMNVLKNDPANGRAIGRLGLIYFEEGRFQHAAPFLFKASELATNDLNLHLKLGFVYLAFGNLKGAEGEADFILDHKPADAEAPLLLAEAAVTEKDVAGARQRLEKLSTKGNQVAIQVALGTLALRERDFKTAAEILQHAETLDPKFSATYTALGALHWAQNDPVQAETAFKTAAELSPPDSPKKLQYAQFEMQVSNLTTAKSIFDEMIKKAPDYFPALLGQAEVALTEKNFDACEKFLGTALARDPDDYDASLLNGRLDLTRGETDKAIAELERLAKVYPDAPQVHYQLGVAYLLDNQVGKSVGNLTVAADLDTNLTDAVLLLAQIQIKTGNLNPALVSLKQLVASQPQLLQAQLLLADAYRALGKSGDALAIYRQLEKSFPQNAQIPLLMGSTLFQQKNNSAARNEFMQTLELDPDNLFALEQLTELDLAEKQLDAALQRIQKMVVTHPEQGELHLLLAKVFIAQGNTNQAEAALSKAIELKPNFQPALLVLAQLYIDSSENQKALATLNAITSKDPKNISAWMLIAMVNNSEKKYQAAADVYEKILAIDPKYGPALNNLAYIYSENLNQLDRANELAQQARNLFPTDPSTADTLGWILWKKGQYPAAANLLQESAGLLPAEPVVQFHLGMAYYMMDNENSARAAFQRALQAGTDFSGYEECTNCLVVLAIDPQTADSATRGNLEKRVAEKSNDPVALLRLAAIYQRDGTTAKAIETYETLLKVTPKNVKAMMALAQLYASNDAQKAFDLAKTAYNLSPGNPDIAPILGRFAYQIGNYKFALSLLQDGAQNQPANPSVLYDYAMAAYSEGKISDAQNAMRNALQAGLLPPRSDEATQFLNLIDLATNPVQAVVAESRVQEILKSNADDVPALMALAVINEKQSNIPAAEQAYEKVLSRYPDFAPAQRKLAIYYANDPSNSGKAYALATKARESFPNDPELGKALGIIVFQQGDYARAANLLKISAAAKSTDAEVFYYLGAAQYHLKNRADSKTSLQQALRLNLTGKLATNARQILTELNH